MGGFFEFHEQVRAKPKPPASGGGTGGAAPDVITVSQVTARIDRVIKAGLPETLHVRGELSSYRPNHASGHVYFTLKDSVCCIDCVMWKSDAARLKFSPVNGMELLATGKVEVYRTAGKYQFYATGLQPLGKGALELAFQQLRARLEADGLFDAERKKPLPTHPMTVVLLTGLSTAALADMVKVLRRFTWLRLLIYPVPVQGDGAAAKIAAALSHLSREGEAIGAEVILLARGGGSLEDLWSFNEEVVARAIAACRLPVVTGIGHEVDTTIADLVADYHAHTPTQAAQVVAHHWRNARDEVDATALRLRRSFLTRLNESRQRLRAIERHEAFRRPLDRINSLRQLLDDRQRAMTLALSHRISRQRWTVQELGSRLDRHAPAALNRLRQRVAALQQAMGLALSVHLRRSSEKMVQLATRFSDCHPKFRLRLEHQRLETSALRLDRASRSSLLLRRQNLEALSRQLQSISPENVLRRGYSMTFRKKDGSLIRGVAQVKAGERLLTRLADGEVESTAADPRQPELF